MPPKTTKQSNTQARRTETRRAFLFVNDRTQSQFYAMFGKRVRELRLQQGLTQEALAAQAGISRTYLAQIEAGQRRLALHVAWNIAHGFGISFDALLNAKQ
jgi:DNA-binding XRE family transcriptional regulator